ncbi:hypothetical protein FGO68_gene8390 [Halteria grandinella]|uniref:Uncharacterized protein n=1 Tax=Halteria grandinella TaxID=5974 RepID=A0A8J8NPH0_HALGN|nr:hypothetical protein FGO68_gene8390 [Halteria grandinella]
MDLSRNEPGSPFEREDPSNHIDDDQEFPEENDLQNNQDNLVEHHIEEEHNPLEGDAHLPNKESAHAQSKGVPVRKFLVDLGKDAGNFQGVDENSEVLKWKKINISIIALTTFLTIIFLQILAFAQNAVPQTNNIAISSGASLTYFILSFVTLGFLYCQYEIVTYGYRSVLVWWRLISLLYGLALVILGAILLGSELGSIETVCGEVWAKMSSNQKAYFNNTIDDLKSERSKNVALMGVFALILGAAICLSAGTQHMLYGEGARKWKAPMTSRVPQFERHQGVDFVWYCMRDDEYDGPHMGQGVAQRKETQDEEEELKAQLEEEEKQRRLIEEAERQAADELIRQQEEEQMRFQAARVQYGSAPGGLSGYGNYTSNQYYNQQPPQGYGRQQYPPAEDNRTIDNPF